MSELLLKETEQNNRAQREFNNYRVSFAAQQLQQRRDYEKMNETMAALRQENARGREEGDSAIEALFNE